MVAKKELEPKSANRWKMTVGCLVFLGLFIIGMVIMAYTGKVEGVKALTGISYGMFTLVGGLLGINMVTPAGGIKGK